MGIYLKARAKINVSLDILGKRDDGYHEMRMVMQTLELHDTLYIKKIDKPHIKLITNLPWLPTDEKNLAYRAAEVLREECNIKQGIFISITKNIPVAAGLAGGSSNCAATLVGIRKLFRLNLPNERMYAIGKSLGADVPFCLMRGTALAEGIGEKLTRLPNHPATYVVLAKPPINVSTKTVFKEFDMCNVKKRPNTEKIISAIGNSDVYSVSQELCNVLETVTEEMHPIVADLKSIMLNHNAMGSIMSGSGPTVFGYFKYKHDAVNAIHEIKSLSIKEVFLTRIYNVQKRY